MTSASVALATTAAVTSAWAVSAAASTAPTGAAATATAWGHPGPWPGMHNGSNNWTHNGSHHRWLPGTHSGANGWQDGMMGGTSGRPGGMMGGTSGWQGGMMGGPSGVTAASCTVPAATGTQVRYAAMDMGGSMMRLMPMWTRVSAGDVTIDLVNRGTMPHELLVYPLAPGQVAGQRPVGANDRVGETSVLGEVEPVCDQPGDVDGIAAGNVGRVTLRLQPGRYEIVCNLPGHYRAGMFATLVVV